MFLNIKHKSKKKNLVILGASGGVSNAFLQLLIKHRKSFDKLILVDKHDSILRSDWIDHKKLRYSFMHKDLLVDLEEIFEEFSTYKNSCIILDLTDLHIEPIIEISDRYGFSYLSCALNIDSLAEYHFSLEELRGKYFRVPHIINLGMNPGIINHFIIKGTLEYGTPNEIVEIEYDSGFPVVDDGNPFLPWSKKGFIEESVSMIAGKCGPYGQYLELEKPAIEELEDTMPYLKPIKELDSYPDGMVVPHEEIISLSKIIEVPGKFVYAIHPVSLKRMKEIFVKKGFILEEDITFVDNIHNKMTGSDLVGVWLNYDDKKVCYYIDLEHDSLECSSATLHMVAVGAISGLLDFIQDPPSDTGILESNVLDNDKFLKITSEYLEVKKFVI